METGKGRWARPKGQASTSTRCGTAKLISRSLNALDALKRQMLGELVTPETSTDLALRLRRAADESASLAWATPYPLFLLPELIVEKANQARRQFEFQEAIQLRSRGSISIAA